MNIAAKVDSSRFDKDWELYVKTTSKTIIEAMNYKMFDAARAAIKGTPKADKASIKDSLNAACRIDPDRTVAQMMVIVEHQNTRTEIQDLTDEVNSLIKKHQKGIGFSKAGWIPAMKELLGKVGRESVTIGGLQQPAFGGAEPARKVGGTVRGSVYNDVDGTGNFSLVENIKEQGAKYGRDKVQADIEQYLEKKLGIPADKFNAS